MNIYVQARWQLMSMRNCFHLMLCCSLSVTLAQILASLFQLPMVLPAQHILWLVLVIIPLLGITMLGNPVDARVMSLANSKNVNHLSKEVQFSVLC